MGRYAEFKRTTSETDITVSIDLDGSGEAAVETGIGFFDHMLISFAKHGLFDLTVTAKGDLYVDCHHTIEDVGIVLGEAFGKALGGKESIKRFGSSIVPMDEALILCAVDLSGRPYINFDVPFTCERIGYMDTETAEEFFRAFSYSCGMNLHIKTLEAGNNHHMCEAAFKAFARALREAVSRDGRIDGVLSTKGSI